MGLAPSPEWGLVMAARASLSHPVTVSQTLGQLCAQSLDNNPQSRFLFGFGRIIWVAPPPFFLHAQQIYFSNEIQLQPVLK